MTDEKTIYHNRKPAHSNEVETDIDKKTGFTYCPSCEDWFKPVMPGEFSKFLLEQYRTINSIYLAAMKAGQR